MYDLVIRNGDVVDGTGLPRYRADVGVKDGRIATIGRIRDKGRDEVDAEGHVVTPGFIDGHTHMDAQVFWDNLGTCSCWNGVTTAVMGNCGFTLAPAPEAQRPMVVRNLERAEDISGAVMEAGIKWSWCTFREYLATLDRLPKGINYASQLGHSALRTYTMGERAFEEPANDDDLRKMKAELKDALDAGAIGFTTSRSHLHALPDGRPVASRLATREEVESLVGVVSVAGHGVFELSPERGARSPDPAGRAEYYGWLARLAVNTGVPVTYGLSPGQHGWREVLDVLDDVAARGGRMFVQTNSRGQAHTLSFKSKLHFDVLPVWKEIRALPLEEQRKAYENPETRRRLVESAKTGPYSTAGGGPREPNFKLMFAITKELPYPNIEEMATKRGVHPVEVMIDLALQTDFEQMFSQNVPEVTAKDEADLIQVLKHPHGIMTFSDSGAHVSILMDSSIQTHLLAYWVRVRQVFTLEEAVRMITLAPAVAWNLRDRGLLREGAIADLNVLDPKTIAPQPPQLVADLPAGGKRLKQKSAGILATVVGGQVFMRNGEHTGALTGRLLRSSLAGAA